MCSARSSYIDKMKCLVICRSRRDEMEMPRQRGWIVRGWTGGFALRTSLDIIKSCSSSTQTNKEPLAFCQLCAIIDSRKHRGRHHDLNKVHRHHPHRRKWRRYNQAQPTESSKLIRRQSHARHRARSQRTQ